MKRLIIGVVVIGLILVAMVFLLSVSINKVKYDGAPLNIAVIGNIPELKNEKIHFESLSLEKVNEDISKLPTNLDAIMLTPNVFEAASDDKYIEVYKGLELPIIFFDSNKRHYPFVNEGLTYETANFDVLDNGSHTTIYLHNINANKFETWYFYLNDKKDINALYTEVFEKIEEL
ncbi:amino acid oxidase [Lysinibacillus endophyticus]|uniref:Amino acid oxidase n=1 Tax=Ureibacillus endophyticus TaxID=1978490 RepID=A0A494YS25_9BACL|nr:amino acid oxidase [Lysinibacillus endophyticus]MCP1144598.1 amino acid oxidase [Lysinibacillus endophyticus]RKQ12479.1 amino acid oxidase [Lysinibacillus endophyticus]